MLLSEVEETLRDAREDRAHSAAVHCGHISAALNLRYQIGARLICPTLANEVRRNSRPILINERDTAHRRS
jgi:hypothetical protein